MLTKTELKKISEGVSTVEALLADMETMRDKYQEKFDAKGDKAQESDKGVEHSELNDKLAAICDSLDSAKDSLSELNEV